MRRRCAPRWRAVSAGRVKFEVLDGSKVILVRLTAREIGPHLHVAVYRGLKFHCRPAVDGATCDDHFHAGQIGPRIPCKPFGGGEFVARRGENIGFLVPNLIAHLKTPLLTLWCRHQRLHIGWKKIRHAQCRLQKEHNYLSMLPQDYICPR